MKYHVTETLATANIPRCRENGHGRLAITNRLPCDNHVIVLTRSYYTTRLGGWFLSYNEAAPIVYHTMKLYLAWCIALI